MQVLLHIMIANLRNLIRRENMLKILEKFRGLIALLAVVLTVFGTLMAMVEYGSFVMLVGVFLLVFAELCEISAKLNK